MAKQTEFHFRVYGRHYNHHDNYTVIFNNEGWYISHIAIGGQCVRDGSPFLYENFRQDSIDYPESMKLDMESIWEHYNQGEITAEQVQTCLDLLANWVDQTGDARPHFPYEDR